MTRTPVQLALTPRHPNPKHPGWGGAREGAGRPRIAKKRSNVPHRARREHVARHPVHATLRIVRQLGNLRTKLRLKALKDALRATHASRGGFRVVHFSLQSDHLHLLVEAEDKPALWRGIRALEIRLARRLNRLAARSGRVFADRYHARALKTPNEVRNAISYVLLNARHHASRPLRHAWLDPCSSAASFDGWSRPSTLPPDYVDDDPARCTVSSETWLLQSGWRVKGAISPAAVPGS
jgi:REP element-mobilizing transposase RayT